MSSFREAQLQFMQASTNYIYIIFAVVYVIYSIIKAGKKVTKNRPTIDQQPQSSPTVHPPIEKQPPQQDFTKMLEDLLGGTQEEKIPEPQLPKVQPPLHKPEPVKISIHNTSKKETATVSNIKPLPAKPHKIPEKTSHSQHYENAKKVFAEQVVVEETESNFDFREAVIYSAILNRPEY